MLNEPKVTEEEEASELENDLIVILRDADDDE